MLETYFFVALGSALGGVARYSLSATIDGSLSTSFPYGTILVNIFGCFIMGVTASLFFCSGGRLNEWTNAKLFLMPGLCGGFTTFSAFSLQTVSLVQENKLMLAALNVTVSCVMCLLAVWGGLVGGSIFK